MRAATLTHPHGHRGLRDAVRAAVAGTHHARPGVGADAGEHAAWWARHAAALALIAENEADPGRAASARADAATARRLSAAMAAEHTAQLQADPTAAKDAAQLQAGVPEPRHPATERPAAESAVDDWACQA